MTTGEQSAGAERGAFVEAAGGEQGADRAELSETFRAAVRAGWLLLPDIRVPELVRVEGVEGRVLRFDRTAPSKELAAAIRACVRPPT